MQLEEMLTFFSNEFPSAFPHEIPKCVSNNITYQSKARYAYCDNFFLFKLVLKRDNGSIVGVVDVLLDLIRL